MSKQSFDLPGGTACSAILKMTSLLQEPFPTGVIARTLAV